MTAFPSSVLETVSTAKSHGGVQGVYRHLSTETKNTDDLRGVRAAAGRGRPAPVLWYLSGLTCTHANVMEKGEYRAAATQQGVIVVAPDTSARGGQVPDEKDNWQFGSGAGFPTGRYRLERLSAAGGASSLAVSSTLINDRHQETPLAAGGAARHFQTGVFPSASRRW
jgi:S-formylglutathione hydrolase FrmB